MLKEKYGLTFGDSKEKVKINRLKEPDKTKYEIYRDIQTALKSAKNWKQFENRLSEPGIELKFKHKGVTSEVQGISFVKSDYSFKDSEIDRSFSYSKLDAILGENRQEQTLDKERNNSLKTSESVVSGIGGLFDFLPENSGYDPEQAEYLRQQKLKKKKRKGLKI
jgi:hypothetical protein